MKKLRKFRVISKGEARIRPLGWPRQSLGGEGWRVSLRLILQLNFKPLLYWASAFLLKGWDQWSPCFEERVMMVCASDPSLILNGHKCRAYMCRPLHKCQLIFPSLQWYSHVCFIDEAMAAPEVTSASSTELLGDRTGRWDVNCTLRTCVLYCRNTAPRFHTHTHSSLLIYAYKKDDIPNPTVQWRKTSTHAMILFIF